MSIRVLVEREVPAFTAADIWVDDGSGYNIVFAEGGRVIAAADQDCYARAAHFALDAAPLDGRTVAWIGGGLCVGPRLFALMGCKQTIYEIEPSLIEFAPSNATFIIGDWRRTLTGQFDIIIYDLGGEVPRSELTRFLAPGGILCPRN